MKTKTKEKTHWTVLRKRRHFITSATQHETFELCNRKWWFQWVRRLEGGISSASQVFGTVVHSVCERYLLADDRGIDRKTGLPVDLYPDGWWIAKSDNPDEPADGEISIAERDIVKRLVSSAIENGILERRPGRRIEHDFRRTVMKLACPDCRGSGTVPFDTGLEPATVHNRPEDVVLVKCETCDGDGLGAHVEIVGFIDVLFHDEAQDHKTTKSMKWAKSKNELRKNRQVLIYAKMILEEAKDNGLNVPKMITLRHNVFCKDPNDLRVRKVEVTVTPEEVEEAWKIVESNAVRMDYFRRMADDWFHLPDPPTGHKACNAYGGCAFRTICGGIESTAGFEDRVDKFLNPVYCPTIEGRSITFYGDQNMSFDAKLAARAGAQQAAGGPAPQMNPPFQQPTPQVQYAPPMQAPPMQAPAMAPQPQYQPVQQAPAVMPPQAMPSPQPVAQAAPPQPQAQPQQGPPPWAQQGCQACGGGGFNSRGQPCAICDIRCQEQNRLQSKDFNVSNVGNGWIQWGTKDGQHTGFSPLPTQTQPVVADQRVAAGPPQGPPAMAPAPGAVPSQNPPAPNMGPTVAPPQGPPSQAPEDNKDDEEESKVGRTKKGFDVLINCSVQRGVETRGNRAIINLDKLLSDCMIEIVQASRQSNPNLTSFYELDVFARRDALGRMAPNVVKTIGNRTLVCEGVGTGASDKRALLDAILSFDCRVIVGNA